MRCELSELCEGSRIAGALRSGDQKSAKFLKYPHCASIVESDSWVNPTPSKMSFYR